MTLSSNISRLKEGVFLCLIISLLFSLIILKTESISPFIILGAGLAPLAIYLGNKIQGAFFLFFFLLSITFLENNEGIAPIEIPFYFFSLILVLYTATEIVRGGLIIETTLDKLFLLLIFLLPYAILLGVFNGSSPYIALGEATNYFGIFAYFPLRKHLKDETFRKLIIGIALLFIFFVLIRNIFQYRQLIAQAVLPWQAEKARAAANEFILLMGSCFFMALAAHSKNLIQHIIYTGLFLVLIGGLILTQSRGYWLAFFIGAVCIFYAINRKGKVKIIFTFILLLSSGLFIANLFFGDLFKTVFNALALRFQTLGSGKLDISLLERFLESKTVLENILSNPISGYGMGYTYSKKILFYGYFIETSYVHNGYLAAWFKFGIVGLITIVSIWFLNIRNSIRLYRDTSDTFKKSLFLTIAGTVTGLLLVNNTSPQVLTFESILFVTLFSAFLSNQSTEEP